MNDRPIAVFDSGLGGLTVVRAIGQQLPGETIVYFGDTARVPYGTKSSRTVLQFAEQDCRFLLQFDPKLVIVACNTASALALRDLRDHVPVPLMGVVEPGAAEAVSHAGGAGVIAVLATEATVASEAYPRAIRALSPRTPVIQQRCPSLVPLIEEGRSGDDPILQALIREYLEPVQGLRPAVVVLGCTHYPLVRDAIAKVMPGAAVVDSADATARQVRQYLTDMDALSSAGTGGRLRCYVSDNPQRFREVGGRFLGSAYGGIRDVIWVTPEQFYDAAVLPTAAGHEQGF
jgi:glutamate racemase